MGDIGDKTDFHAAVAIGNAKLFQAEREAAETSAALLRLSQALTGLHTVFTLVDANHHTEDWTFMMKDKPIHAHFDLQRTKTTGTELW